MHSLLSHDQRRRRRPEDLIRSARIFAQGALAVLLILWGWKWWTTIPCPFIRYIQAVCALLFLMSLCAAIITIERSLRYRASRKQSDIFQRQLAAALDSYDFDHAMALAERFRKSLAAEVVTAGLASFQVSATLLSGAEMIAAVQRTLTRSVNLAHEELKCDLHVLASIASTAPLVGALGCVFGIVRAFQGVAGARLSDLAMQAEGIAEALSLAAWGVLLGTLTMWGHAYLTTELEVLDAGMKNQTLDLENCLGRSPVLASGMRENMTGCDFH